jgi:hypothetical protein
VKSLCRASSLVSFAAFLCFLPCASGQSTANLKVTGSGHKALNVEPSNLLAFALTSGDDFFKDNKNKKEDGCDSRDDKWGGKCAAAPEGGTPLMYLLLAGFSCLGAMVFRSRRQMSLRHTD